MQNKLTSSELLTVVLETLESDVLFVLSLFQSADSSTLVSPFSGKCLDCDFALIFICFVFTPLIGTF
jgi:hypothetical protein